MHVAAEVARGRECRDEDRRAAEERHAPKHWDDREERDTWNIHMPVSWRESGVWHMGRNGKKSCVREKGTGADLPTDGLLVYALEAEALERGEGKGGEAETLLDRVAEQRDGKAQRSSASGSGVGAVASPARRGGPARDLMRERRSGREEERLNALRVRPQRARRARQHWQPQRREQPHGHIAYCRRWTRFNFVAGRTHKLSHQIIVAPGAE